MDKENKEQQEQTVILKDEALKRFQGGFTAIPNVILENTGITLGARMTYAMLLKYAWQKDFCFPAHKRIAKDLGVSERSVRTFLDELRGKELIEWKRRGLTLPNIYYILALPSPDNKKPLINQGTANIAVQERQPASVQERQPASYKEYTVNNTNVNVNALFKTTERKPETVKPAHNGNGKRGGYRVDLAKLNDMEANLLGRILEVCQDRENGANYLNVIRTNPENVLDMVISETRQAGLEGRIKKTAGAYFMDTLKRITDAREQAKNP